MHLCRKNLHKCIFFVLCAKLKTHGIYKNINRRRTDNCAEGIWR